MRAIILKKCIQGLLITALLLTTATAHAGSWKTIGRLIDRNDAIAVMDGKGRMVYSKHPDRKLIPASILKVFTALVAFHYLGEDHRFATEFYLDNRFNLIIKGYGDPLLISEEIHDICGRLGNTIKSMRDIALDDSYFQEPLTIPGVSSTAEPYDAPNGALCVNFNTVTFRKKNGQYVSGESQTPLLPMALKRIRKTGLKKGRITLSHNHNEITMYTGKIFNYFFNLHGIQTSGVIREQIVDDTADRLIHTHVSRYSTAQIIAKLLEYSNNFTANQLLIASGAKRYGAPGNLKKGVDAAKAYAAKHLGIRDIVISEGSGIARNNRISANEMLMILNQFAPHRALMRQGNGEYFKTGSLSKVKTRAGYIESVSGSTYRYVVMVNTPSKTTDKIMAALHRSLN